MFHYLFQAKDPETGQLAYTPDDLFGEAVLLIVAGSDTTKTAVAAMIFYIVRNPRVYKKLTDEIRSTFSTVDEIRWGQKLFSCKYLRACLDESLRMSPPVPSDLNREVLPGGIEIEGKFVPEGINVGTNTYSLHYNELAFPDPFLFRPERWIVSERNSAADVAAAQQSFVPFSAGPRACVGKNLAYLELMVTVGRLLYRTDVRISEDGGREVGQGGPGLMWGRRNEGQFQLKDMFVTKEEGPVVQFKRRWVDSTYSDHSAGKVGDLSVIYEFHSKFLNPVVQYIHSWINDLKFLLLAPYKFHM